MTETDWIQPNSDSESVEAFIDLPDGGQLQLRGSDSGTGWKDSVVVTNGETEIVLSEGSNPPMDRAKIYNSIVEMLDQ